MNWLSTDPPPFFPTALAGILSTTEPPRSSTKQMLAELASDGVPLTSQLWRLRQLLALEVPARITVPRRPAYQSTPEQRDELARMRARSADVMLTLAATPLLARTAVTAAGAWDPLVGIPASSLQFDLNGTQTFDLAAVAHGAYRASVSDVAQTMANAPAGSQLIIEAQAPSPVLFLATALRLHRRGVGAYASTCAVMDVVVAWVTVTVHLLKHALAVPRPHDFPGPPAIDPTIPVPGYAAYPSGHAAVCHAARTVLADLLKAGTPAAQALEALADGIALNRERAGLHCAADSAAGKTIGVQLGQWLLAAVAASSAGGALLSLSALFAAAASEWE